MRGQGVDLATSLRKRADYTVVAVWAVTPHRDLLCLHVHRARIAAPDQIPTMKRLHQQWGTQWVGIETGGYQLSAVQNARFEGLPVKELRADGDKLARALTVAGMMEGGKVWFDTTADWWPDLYAELMVFPNGRHDDQIDTLAYAGLNVHRRRRRYTVAAFAHNTALASPNPFAGVNPTGRMTE